jgi:hypothetical protein
MYPWAQFSAGSWRSISIRHRLGEPVNLFLISDLKEFFLIAPRGGERGREKITEEDHWRSPGITQNCHGR